MCTTCTHTTHNTQHFAQSPSSYLPLALCISHPALAMELIIEYAATIHFGKFLWPGKGTYLRFNPNLPENIKMDILDFIGIKGVRKIRFRDSCFRGLPLKTYNDKFIECYTRDRLHERNTALDGCIKVYFYERAPKCL